MKRTGLVQAASVAGYCSLVGYLFFVASSVFGKTPSYFAPVTFLLLFCTSVLICALLFFYKTYLLFFSNKKREAIDLVRNTTIWLIVFFIVFLFVAYAVR